jgi:GT2 family glycosyltransferase
MFRDSMNRAHKFIYPNNSSSHHMLYGPQRLRAEGRFLYSGKEKFFIKGVTYGAFAPNRQGEQFPEPPDVAKDFTLMRQVGINTVLTYTVPPLSLLDQALEYGIGVIVNPAWMAYVCFLDSETMRGEIRRQVKEGIASCREHPALSMYCIGKEIPPQIVRWHGRKRMEAFLQDLYKVSKDTDPGCLVTYTNFPTTEYLDLSFVDVHTFNVYLHQRPDFCAYLSRLQHIAGELPMVLTEFGMCSLRHSREGQAAFLDWQIEEIFDHGLAGAIVFSWTDPFFQDGLLIDNWAFGLVDADRKLKPSSEVVRRRFTMSVPFPPMRKWPKISVVVATYNSAQTLEGCLSSLQNLTYPDYEIIVVNDGSTDGSQDIIDRYPFRTITTANQGVSAARNEGLYAAKGDIVAYIDSDAKADPDWLTYLATTFLESRVAAVGGPNFLPEVDNWIAHCVYRSPGGPTQVMMDDQSAEHIPGCNMAFWKLALEEIGGFDPGFTKAGDDVDICWRLLERGYKIGFSPSAVVWHHRRQSVKAYWRQQVGYGDAEALLERKHPNKFNPWGHTVWNGRIYAPYPFFRLFGRPLIYQGLWGSAGFQSMYDTGGGGVLSFLPRSMEWHLALVILAVLGLFYPWFLLIVGVGIAHTGWYCMACASGAKLKPLFTTTAPPGWLYRLRSRGMIAWLHFLEPLARDWGRIKGGLTPWRTVNSERHRTRRVSRWWQHLQPFRRKLRWAYPGEMELEKHNLLVHLTKKLSAKGWAVGWNADWQNWDLKVRRGAFCEAHLRTVIEHLGGPNRIARLSAVIQLNKPIYWFQGVLLSMAVGMGALNQYFPFVLCLALFGVLWITPIVEANLIETAVLNAADELIEQRDLQPPYRG